MTPIHRVGLALSLFSGVLIGGLTIAGQEQTCQPFTGALSLHPSPSDWIHFRRTYDHQAYSPLTQVNRQNVHELTLAWSWMAHPGAFEGTPQVHDGYMFLANPNGGVQAFNAATGELLWEFQTPIARPQAKQGYGVDNQRNPEEARAGGIGNAAGPSRPVRNVALWGNKVYTATSEIHGGRVVALDATSGKIVWEKKTEVGGETAGDHSAGPIVVKGKVMLGS